MIHRTSLSMDWKKFQEKVLEFFAEELFAEETLLRSEIKEMTKEIRVLDGGEEIDSKKDIHVCLNNLTFEVVFERDTEKR